MFILFFLFTVIVYIVHTLIIIIVLLVFNYDRKPASLEELEVNQLIWAVLESLRSTDCEEIMIDSSGTWRPLPMSAQITSENNNGSSFISHSL